MIRSVLFVLAGVLLSLQVAAQINRQGPSFGIGLGSGYSKHAGSYSAVAEDIYGTLETFSSFRILAIDLKAGYGLAPLTQIHFTLKYTPPNTTISPYKSFYRGFMVSHSFGSLEKLIYTAGAGINQARDKEGMLGKGTMIHAGIGYEFDQHFLIEANSTFGKMENNPGIGRFIDSANEFALFFTVNYLFYKEKEDQ